MIVKSNAIYSPQSYLEAITGNCYFFNTGKPIPEQITDILKVYRHPTENYLLKDTGDLLHKDISVVLVDCCDVVEDDDHFKTEYRWFIVPADFGE